MIVDTSAIVAILLREPDRRALIEAVESADSCRISAVTLVETSMVLESRRGPQGLRELDEFLKLANFETIPVDVGQAELARGAFSRFGKGRHRAALNMGDCFSYALARAFGEPLLCKGNDFIHTDIRIAVAGSGAPN